MDETDSITRGPRVDCDQPCHSLVEYSGKHYNNSITMVYMYCDERRTTDVNAHYAHIRMEPTAATRAFPPGRTRLAKTYMKLFVNRLSYCEQSPYGDHRYHRPKHPELKTLAGRRAAMEMPGQKWAVCPTLTGQTRFTSNS